MHCRGAPSFAVRAHAAIGHDRERVPFPVQEA